MSWKTNRLVANYEGEYKKDRLGEPMWLGTVSIQLYAPEDGTGKSYLYFKDSNGRHTRATIARSEVSAVADLINENHTDRLLGYLNDLYWDGDSENLLK